MASKKAYTKKQKEDYLKKRDKYICCPKCGKNVLALLAREECTPIGCNLYSTSGFLKEGFAEWTLTCHHCGHRWAEIYALVDIDKPMKR